MLDYGFRIYRHGVVVHTDGRKRGGAGPGRDFIVSLPQGGPRRGAVRELSGGSKRSLEFVAANAAVEFRTFLSLTYRENPEAWEEVADRNARVVRRSKHDLNRFLSALRKEVGAYLWAREFQERGVVHYHVLTEGAVSEERARVVWCRAIGALGDVHVLRHGAKVRVVKNQMRSRLYLVRYVGKEIQKKLPAGVAAAGRWWGRSRGMKLDLVLQLVSCEAGATRANPARVRVLRTVRRFLGKEFGHKFRGGAFVHWGDKLITRLLTVVEQLRAFYGDVAVEDMVQAVKGAEVDRVA
jgi:hypothetical protein